MKWYNGITVTKDPDANLPFRWDWSDWVPTNDSIASAVVTSDSGITDDGGTVNGDYVDVVVSGGTAGTSYSIAVKVTTSEGYIDERTVIFRVRNR